MARDRDGSFEPLIVPKHARRPAGFDEAVVSLYAKGLTAGEIQAHDGDVRSREHERLVLRRRLRELITQSAAVVIRDDMVKLPSSQSDGI